MPLDVVFLWTFLLVDSLFPLHISQIWVSFYLYYRRNSCQRPKFSIADWDILSRVLRNVLGEVQKIRFGAYIIFLINSILLNL